MYLSNSLSDQQNGALWVICTFVAVATTALFAAGLLGFLQRKSQPKA